MSRYSAQEVMTALDPSVRKLIGQILAIEKEYRHIGNLSEINDDDICKRIISEIEKVVKNEN